MNRLFFTVSGWEIPPNYIYIYVQYVSIGGFNPFEIWESSPNRDEQKKYLSCHHLDHHLRLLSLRLRVAKCRQTTIDSPPFRAPQHALVWRTTHRLTEECTTKAMGKTDPVQALASEKKLLMDGFPSEVYSYLPETNSSPCYPPGKLVVGSRETILISFWGPGLFSGDILVLGRVYHLGKDRWRSPLPWKNIMAPQKKIQLLGVSCHLLSLRCMYPP